MADSKLITVVVPFCRKDRKQAIDLLNWCRELDGKQANTCLLVADCGKIDDKDYKYWSSEIYEVHQAARESFATVKTITTPYKLDDESWPIGPNWLFKTACDEISRGKYGSWLWLEPDCVPMKRGWLEAIQTEYAQVGKPFMGTRVQQNNKTVNMGGCGIYPEKASDTYKNMNMSIPWDVQCVEDVVPFCHFSKLFWFFWGTHKLSPTFIRRQPVSKPENAMLLSSIPEGTALFHRNKDGTLIDLLRHDLMADEASPSYTVVITSYKRPDFLRMAFSSCVNAGVRNIVITATGVDDKMRACFRDLASTVDKSVRVRIMEHGPEVTSNQSWFLGVEAAETEYCSLLHDDDLILPAFIDCVRKGINRKADFIVVDAAMHGTNSPFKDSFSKEEGFLSAGMIRDRVFRPGALAISPIRGVFKKTDLASWLRYAEGLPKSCYYRPDFLVGNDLIIWMKACETYSQFFNAPVNGVSFGYHKESTTVKDLGKERRLQSTYEIARQWHLQKNKPTVEVETKRIDILTIVLDGMPWIACHLPVFNKLSIPWHWHIVEGAAMNTHCTKWCNPQTPRLSKDGTNEYLDSISGHPNITVYRKEKWDGKVEMVNAPLANIKKECVLLEVDCDEMWTTKQLEDMVEMFESDKDRTHAMFWCRMFFGPHLVMTTRNCYANNPGQDWKRAWRFKPGASFKSHEPPSLIGEHNGFSHSDTESRGLVFDHYAYATLKQAQFKEQFYRYNGAAEQWKRLQECDQLPVRISDFLGWVKDKSCVAKSI